ncbi:urease accessory protein UreD [Noviherbaspirillum sp. Root189]|uniref:urease accessory protein UreD n=1 Tax=Noviherbaspirillum sp. Root189 TaxID=1736487 RepID=UPI00070D5E5B|nr:urease accessory protein UreD [Noviherbaspirillum sp. Root189]KRB93044.1 urease accessory protein UreD [Noviherbaspirillum sp. Root189]
MKRIATDPVLAPPSHARWQAQLTLGFVSDRDTTRLMERTHRGPLRVQKPLYPEGGQVCHAIVVHPPGGVVGGDELRIDASVGQNAGALLTTPGAAKWYKANGHISRQDVHLQAGDSATLEWLPQETIFFDAAHVRLDTAIELGTDATYIGTEILCFGRTASGESFDSGMVEQKTSIRRDGKLLWFEQGMLAAGSAAMTSPLGLAGNTVCATLIAVGKPLAASMMATLREADVSDGAFGVTQMKSVIVARYLGHSSQTARRLMMHTWQRLRPALTGREAVVPRIWNT